MFILVFHLDSLLEQEYETQKHVTMFSWVQYFQPQCSTKAHKDTTTLLSRSLCLWLSLSMWAKQQTFCFRINVFYLFWELHISSSPPHRCLNPSGASQGSSWHMVRTGEPCWRLPGCGPQSPDARWHIVFKHWYCGRNTKSFGGIREAFFLKPF